MTKTRRSRSGLVEQLLPMKACILRQQSVHPPLPDWSGEEMMLVLSRFLVVLLPLALVGSAARADLRFTQPAADVGDVRSGTPLTQRYEFVNEGPESVQIVNVRASCGCMKPDLNQRSFGPGEQGSLVVEVNTLSQPPGPNTWLVQVSYDAGGSQRDAVLQLKARLTCEISVQPAAMTIFTDKAVRHEVIVFDRRPKPLGVTAVQTSSPKLKAQVAEQYKDMQARWVRKVRMEVAEDYPEGRHEEVLSIYTDDPGYSELRIPVTVVKRPRQRVTATPSTVTLQAPPGQPVPSRIVLLRDAENGEVLVEHVTADSPALRFHWAKGPETMATLKVSADRSLILNGKLQSAVHVQIRQPVQQTITIPVTCVAP